MLGLPRVSLNAATRDTDTQARVILAVVHGVSWSQYRCLSSVPITSRTAESG